MSIKVSVSKDEPTSRGKPYPKLMTTDHGLVVLMTEFEVGTVVKISDEHPSINELGVHRSDWMNQHFLDFVDSVTLENI